MIPKQIEGCKQIWKKPCRFAVSKLLLFLLVSVLSTTLIVQVTSASQNTAGSEGVWSNQQVMASDSYPLTFSNEPQSSINITNPKNQTYYTTNTSTPLTFTIYGFTSWIGYSLNGQQNVTISGNTTLPTLPDGWHSIVIFANDTLGNMKASPVNNFAIDTIAPTGSITVNNGATSITDPSVTLTLSAQDATSGVAQMRFFESTWGDWEAYATSKPWTFKAGDGYKTLYVQFRDNAGLVSMIDASSLSACRLVVSLGAAPSPDQPLSQSTTQEIPKETPKATPSNLQPQQTQKPSESEAPKETASPPPSTPTPKSEADMQFVVAVASITSVIVLIGALTLVALKRQQ